ETPQAVAVLARQGREALKRLYPAQERDRTQFHALEAVNADGHKADVFVHWPGEAKPVRPVLLSVQDLYSNMIVGWRVGLTESAHLVQLAFGDVFRDFGIPDHAWLDNGRGFASKWITGQQPTRFRFKVSPADPAGVLTQLGVQVHWTTPYSGQSKPIERSFRDLCDHLWKHPAFEGAYTGNRPDAKPENYQSRAVPYDKFMEIVGQGIALHNARKGRRTRVCGGALSFDEAFQKSYARAPIKQARPEHLRMCLMAVESVTARQPAGAVHVMGNRYWADFLTGQAGRKVIARFDPDNLHDGVEVYRLDGARLGFAACWEAAGFADVDAAREHTRARRKWVRANRDMADAEIAMSIEQVAAMLPRTEPAKTQDPAVVRPYFGGALPQAAAAAEEDFNFDEAFAAGLTLVTGGLEDG
ncbi:MAG: Mu transposase C-terminal domain-containing protein, partial [Proteobacteria bacterium]|nr:Mu transposase C-terminal domain-containing protein [Pseudomonadota bacterium]